MAYTNAFKLFGENSSNLENNTTWASNPERSTGFVSGAVAKSKNVNTAIKSNSIVTMGLMNFVATYSTSSGTLGLNSTAANIKDALVNVFQNNSAFTTTTDTANGDKITLKLFGGSGVYFNVVNAKKALQDTDGDAIKATYGTDLLMSVNSTTEVITVKLKNKNGSAIGTGFTLSHVKEATIASIVTFTAKNNNVNYDILFGSSGSVYYASTHPITYNPNTGKLTATTFKGDLIGDVEGNADTATTASKLSGLDTAWSNKTFTGSTSDISWDVGTYQLYVVKDGINYDIGLMRIPFASTNIGNTACKLFFMSVGICVITFKVSVGGTKSVTIDRLNNWYGGSESITSTCTLYYRKVQ